MSPSPEAAELLSIFQKKNPDGTARYSQAEISAFVPLLALASEEPFEQLTPDLQLALMELCARIGIREGMEDDALHEAVLRHYQGSPLNQELTTEFLEYVRRHMTPDFDLSPERLAKSFSALNPGPERHVPIAQKNVFGDDDSES